MRHVKLDKAPPAVKKFIRELPVEAGGIALEMDGEVVGTFSPPNQLSNDERDALIANAKNLMRQARARNKGVPARVIQQEIREAVEEVRRRTR